jgi:hypothetical protein
MIGIRDTEFCTHNERDAIYCTPNLGNTEVKYLEYLGAHIEGDRSSALLLAPIISKAPRGQRNV